MRLRRSTTSLYFDMVRHFASVLRSWRSWLLHFWGRRCMTDTWSPRLHWYYYKSSCCLNPIWKFHLHLEVVHCGDYISLEPCGIGCFIVHTGSKLGNGSVRSVDVLVVPDDELSKIVFRFYEPLGLGESSIKKLAIHSFDIDNKLFLVLVCGGYGVASCTGTIKVAFGHAGSPGRGRANGSVCSLLLWKNWLSRNNLTV